MIELNALSNQVAGKVQLSSSKSISNRLLILSAMAKNNLKLSNLSDADDTKLLDQILLKHFHLHPDQLKPHYFHLL